eukprot:GHVN01079927.1.p1 GENE.GHVN01079927.1~~GHVN01079927.1.p1  ORF type:complete len:1143 (+),score=155.45 GHVN01079927.1:28-3456(+)
MGIGKFYRWLSERYPLINEELTCDQIPDFDNLYLDMNGIIHNCSHANSGGSLFASEDDLWLSILQYINKLVAIIRPRKVLYLAIDGVAPRAKMNQQRCRRFRTAQESAKGMEKLKAWNNANRQSGGNVKPFDSNAITPGSEFMESLMKNLNFFVGWKLNNDPLWQGMEIVLSGPDTPGEGEHKIMDYIRCSKAQPYYDNNTKHCLYGLDADLIMLSLASHEPNFSLLREEIEFPGPPDKFLQAEKRLVTSKEKFQLLHVSLLREYFQLDLCPPGRDLERTVDDFILFCIFVGNDFLPTLPTAEIGGGGLQALIELYKEYHSRSKETDPYLTRSCGEINWKNLEAFLVMWVGREEQEVATMVSDAQYMRGKSSRHRGGGHHGSGRRDLDAPQMLVRSNDDYRRSFYQRKMGFDAETNEGIVARDNLAIAYLEGLQWVLFYYFRGTPSWSWYYKHLYPPFGADILKLNPMADGTISQIICQESFEISKPFLPLQQLMAVLPPGSSDIVPEVFRPLMLDPESSVKWMYPNEFEVDMEGVKVPWGGVTKIPFIDEEALLAKMDSVSQSGSLLTPTERLRNQHGSAHIFTYRENVQDMRFISPITSFFSDFNSTCVVKMPYEHPPFPVGTTYFPNQILPGWCRGPPLLSIERVELSTGGRKVNRVGRQFFPTLKEKKFKHNRQTGVKVFGWPSRSESVFLFTQVAIEQSQLIEQLKTLCQSFAILVDYPFRHVAQPVALWTSNYRWPLNDHGHFYPEPIFQIHHEKREQCARTIQNLAKRGVSLDPEQVGIKYPVDQIMSELTHCEGQLGTLSESSLSEVMVEVRLAAETYIEKLGASEAVSFIFDTKITFHPICLTSGFNDSAHLTTPLTSGDEVIALDLPLKGSLGKVQACVGERAAVVWSLPLVDRGVSEVMAQRCVHDAEMGSKWYSFNSLIRRVMLPPCALETLLGVFELTTSDGNFRKVVDLGMGLRCYGRPRTFLPGLSRVRNDTLEFSEASAELIDRYRLTWPIVINKLSEGSEMGNHGGKIDAKNFFSDPTVSDPSWLLDLIGAWVIKQPFKTVKSAAVGMSQSCGREAIQSLEQCAWDANNTLPLIRAQASPCNVDALLSLSGDYKPPLTIFDTQVFLGARVVYVKCFSLVPVGAKA